MRRIYAMATACCCNCWKCTAFCCRHVASLPAAAGPLGREDRLLPM